MAEAAAFLLPIPAHRRSEYGFGLLNQHLRAARKHGPQQSAMCRIERASLTSLKRDPGDSRQRPSPRWDGGGLARREVAPGPADGVEGRPPAGRDDGIPVLPERGICLGHGPALPAADNAGACNSLHRSSDLFRRHQHREVGVGAGHHREDRGIDDAQALHALDPALAVDHRHGIVGPAHPA